MIGKRIRMERIMDGDSGKTVIIPMDHGVTLGPVNGLVRLGETIRAIARGGANAIVIHKGLVEVARPRITGGQKAPGLIIHLSASTQMAPDSNCKTIVCTVEEAVRLGADVVSVHVNLGADDEKTMLRDLGATAREATAWGMPLLAMIYTRGPKVQDPYDVNRVKHAARVGAELGADIVKVVYTGSPETFREVVQGCFVPVVIAGGERMGSDQDILEMVRGSVEAGGAGVSIGRNVFQHEDPAKIVEAICKIVHRGSLSGGEQARNSRYQRPTERPAGPLASAVQLEV